MSELLDLLTDTDASKVEAARMPDWIAPMHATLTDRPFTDAEWLFEHKLDGMRCLAYCRNGRAAFYTRNKRCRNDHFPELVEALEATIRGDCVLDGEVVAFEKGVCSLTRLQERFGIGDPEAARESGIELYFYVFDCPWMGGYDLRRLTLRDRKRVLRQGVAFADPIVYTPHRDQDGEAFFKEACRQGWEGLIARRGASVYCARRTGEWLKLRCDARQEFVIGGFTEPRGRRRGFGALLIGYYDNGGLRYAGRVGTGFDEATLIRLRGRLDRRERTSSPFADRIDEDNIHWVMPHLVGEVAFAEWTDYGKLRHPRFVSLRDDKPAHKVIRERPA